MTHQQNQWVKTIDQLSHQPSTHLTPWLVKPYILSQALRRICQNLTVNLLSQDFDMALEDEYEILGCDKQTLPLIRKIFLLGDELPLTFGRVIISPRTYENYFLQLSTLGASPLGETLLYHHPDVTRSAFEFAALNESHSLFKEVQVYYTIGELTAPLFSRRSVFWMKQFPLLVTEIFLPTLPVYCPE